MSKINEYGQTCVQYRLKRKLYLSCKYLILVDWNIIWRILSYHLYATIFIMPLFDKNVNVNHHFKSWYLVITCGKIVMLNIYLNNDKPWLLGFGKGFKYSWFLFSQTPLESWFNDFVVILWISHVKDFFWGQMWLLVKKD